MWEGKKSLSSHSQRCISCWCNTSYREWYRSLSIYIEEEGRRSTKSGQTVTSGLPGPVDHTCQKKPYCEPNPRAIMSQVETQSFLIGLGLWVAARSKRAVAGEDSLYVLNVGNDLCRASFKGPSGLSTSRHVTIRGSSQRISFRRKRICQRHCQSNFVSSEARRCLPELLAAVSIDQQEWGTRGQAQKGQSWQS